MRSPGRSAQQDILAGDKHSCPGHPKTASATTDPLPRTLLRAPVPSSVLGTHRHCSRRRCSQQGSGTSLWQCHTAPRSCTHMAARSYGRTTQGSTLRETEQQWPQRRNRENGVQTPNPHGRVQPRHQGGKRQLRWQQVDAGLAQSMVADPADTGLLQSTPESPSLSNAPRGEMCPKRLRQHERLQATLR